VTAPLLASAALLGASRPAHSGRSTRLHAVLSAYQLFHVLYPAMPAHLFLTGTVDSAAHHIIHLFRRILFWNSGPKQRRTFGGIACLLYLYLHPVGEGNRAV
jgi:hypothetical protein